MPRITKMKRVANFKKYRHCLEFSAKNQTVRAGISGAYKDQSGLRECGLQRIYRRQAKQWATANNLLNDFIHADSRTWRQRNGKLFSSAKIQEVVESHQRPRLEITWHIKEDFFWLLT